MIARIASGYVRVKNFLSMLGEIGKNSVGGAILLVLAPIWIPVAACILLDNYLEKKALEHSFGNLSPVTPKPALKKPPVIEKRIVDYNNCRDCGHKRHNGLCLDGCSIGDPGCQCNTSSLMEM